MKKLILITLLIILGSILWARPLSSPQPRPGVTVSSATKIAPASIPAAFHTGDTQNIGDMNVTVDKVYSVNPTVFGVDISTDYPYPLDPQFIPKGAWIYTSDGQYVHSSSVNGTHIYFTIPSNVYVDTFLFYDFKWYL